MLGQVNEIYIFGAYSYIYKIDLFQKISYQLHSAEVFAQLLLTSSVCADV